MASATVSAWGRPPGAVAPTPTICPSLTMRQPTGGFSAVRPTARRPTRSACAIRRWSSPSRRAVIVARKFTQHLFEILGLAEIAVYRGEAHIGDVVKGPQPFHDEIADGLGGDIGFPGAFELADDRRDHALDPVGIDRPLAQCDLDRAHQLVAIEGNPPPRPLDHLQLAQLHPFESGEAPAAFRAVPATANGRAVLGGTAVLHLGVIVVAIGTAHHFPQASPRGRPSP